MKKMQPISNFEATSKLSKLRLSKSRLSPKMELLIKKTCYLFRKSENKKQLIYQYGIL